MTCGIIPTVCTICIENSKKMQTINTFTLICLQLDLDFNFLSNSRQQFADVLLTKASKTHVSLCFQSKYIVEACKDTWHQGHYHVWLPQQQLLHYADYCSRSECGLWGKNNRQVCLRVTWCIGWVWFALPLSIRLFLCLTFYTVPWLWWAGSASSHPYRGCLVGICFGSISAVAGKENSCFCTMTWRRVLSPHTVKYVRWQTRQEIVGRMDFVFCFK